jgi:hypothetical protein
MATIQKTIGLILNKKAPTFFGILFYLLGNDKSHSVQTDFGGAIKHVYFLNVVYGFDFKKSEMAKEFLKKGNAPH